MALEGWGLRNAFTAFTRFELLGRLKDLVMTGHRLRICIIALLTYVQRHDHLNNINHHTSYNFNKHTLIRKVMCYNTRNHFLWTLEGAVGITLLCFFYWLYYLYFAFSIFHHLYLIVCTIKHWLGISEKINL